MLELTLLDVKSVLGDGRGMSTPLLTHITALLALAG